MNGYIICGFSGIGKTTAEEKHRRILDFESSGFSHVFDPDTLIRPKNADFPKNYIDALEKLIENNEATFYLLSCHQEVRDELKKRGLDYIIVMPNMDAKNEYLKRWLRRGSPIEFIVSMNKRWVDMIHSCEYDDAPKIYLGDDEYIGSLLNIW